MCSSEKKRGKVNKVNIIEISRGLWFNDIENIRFDLDFSIVKFSIIKLFAEKDYILTPCILE